MLPFEPSQSSSQLRKCVNVVEKVFRRGSCASMWLKKYFEGEAVLDVMTAFLQRGFLC